MNHRLSAFLLILLTSFFSLSAQDLVKNGGFTAGDMNSWSTPGWLKNTLKPSMEKDILAGASPFSLRFTGAEGKVGILNQYIHFLKGVKKYNVSVKIKTENFKNWGYASCYVTTPKTSKSVWVQNVGAGNNTNLSLPWKEYKQTITVPEAVYKDGCTGTLYLQLQEGNTGSVWFDDISIVPVMETPAAPAAAPAK